MKNGTFYIPMDSDTFPDPVIWYINADRFYFTSWKFSGTLMRQDPEGYTEVVLIGKERTGRTLQFTFTEGDYDMLHMDGFPGVHFWFKPRDRRQLVAGVVIHDPSKDFTVIDDLYELHKAGLLHVGIDPGSVVTL